jgi:hypothetical protein
MARVIADRMTAEIEGDFVVFLIGMPLANWFPQAEVGSRQGDA